MMTTGLPEHFYGYLRKLARDKDFILILDRMNSIGKDLFDESLEIAHAVMFHYTEGERSKSELSGKFQGGSAVGRLVLFCCFNFGIHQCLHYLLYSLS